MLERYSPEQIEQFEQTGFRDLLDDYNIYMNIITHTDADDVMTMATSFRPNIVHSNEGGKNMHSIFTPRLRYWVDKSNKAFNEELSGDSSNTFENLVYDNLHGLGLIDALNLSTKTIIDRVGERDIRLKAGMAAAFHALGQGGLMVMSRRIIFMADKELYNLAEFPDEPLGKKLEDNEKGYLHCPYGDSARNMFAGVSNAVRRFYNDNPDINSLLAVEGVKHKQLSGPPMKRIHLLNSVADIVMPQLNWGFFEHVTDSIKMDLAAA